ncbi:MAG: ATP-dependent zinc metalloprotease FtsH [Oscillospiraceae bacterium]|nr:ATP-dependent zinc metalloprotease FtsH [Oscillospiraceae bacterium]
MIFAFTWLNRSSQPERLTYAQVLLALEGEYVEKVEIEDNELTVQFREDSPFFERFGGVAEIDLPLGWRDSLMPMIDAQILDGILSEDSNIEPPVAPPWWIVFIPYLILIVVVVLLWYFMIKRSGGGEGGRAMRFGRARTRIASEDQKKLTFDDVAGLDEERMELEEIVDFLKHPKRYIDIGARIPKGVLLVGPPGTGKTTIAKAVAGEAGTQFLSISGSDFVELYVGVGASRVRDLFEQAKKTSPSLIFIDEIDAVGRQRGAGMGGGHDEREQTLNQLLVEMDGFATNEGVIIIAATNRPDILDPALLRPGRFDRQVYLGMPDIKGREAILKIHAKGKSLDGAVDLNVLAKKTPGFTGADLENLLNEAALLAARNKQKAVRNEDLHEAMLKVIAGPEKKSQVVIEHERKLTAYHEAGHAIVMRHLPTHDPVHHISIIPRGMAGGMTISLPQEDRRFMSKLELQERIVSFLGGRVAEKLILDDISTGAGNDIQRATALARNMVTKYGMSDKLGPVNFAGDHEEVFLGRDYGHMRNYSESVAAIIDEEVKAIIDNAYTKCQEILNANMQVLHDVAAYLLKNETMDGETFAKYFE